MIRAPQGIRRLDCIFCADIASSMQQVALICIASAVPGSRTPMIIRFRVENHRSIRKEQELSFVAAPLKERPEHVVRIPQLNVPLLRVVGVYGANASGKSTLLKALAFMRNAVLHSHRDWDPEGSIPREPFLLSTGKASEPSSFEVDAIIGGVRYTYGFVVSSTQVREEWLYAYPQGKKQRWFVRDTSKPKQFNFSRFLSGENKLIQSLTRKNSLFLSAAAQNNHRLLTPIFEWFRNQLRIVDENNRETLNKSLSKSLDAKLKAEILKLLRGADLGIIGFDIEDRKVPDLSIQILETMLSDQPEMLKRLRADPTIPEIFLLHHIEGNDKDVPFPLEEESRGTQAFLFLSLAMVETLATGGVLCIDELDASLHPLMAIEIVKTFDDPLRNPNNAQLLFNTHDTNILEYGALRRDQIWFTEKDAAGATHLYALNDYKARKQENIRRGYLQGRYGAVPFIRIPNTLFSKTPHGKTKTS